MEYLELIKMKFEMKKLNIKTVSKTAGTNGKEKSTTDFVSKEGTYEGFEDLQSAAINQTFEECNYEVSRMFFLNAMNQYESRMNREFNE